MRTYGKWDAIELHRNFFFEGQTVRARSKFNQQLVSLREKSKVGPHGVHFIIVFSALERRNCFYRERVLWSFRVENLTITRTKENCDIRGEERFLMVINAIRFLNAILEKQFCLVWVEPGEDAFCFPPEGWYETAHLCKVGFGSAARTKEAFRNLPSKWWCASPLPESWGVFCTPELYSFHYGKSIQRKL